VTSWLGKLLNELDSLNRLNQFKWR